MRKLKIALGIAVLLLFATQNATAWINTNEGSCDTQCDFPEGCYYVDFCGNYTIESCSCNQGIYPVYRKIDLSQNDCNPETGKLCLKLRINYNDDKTTLVEWKDVGSNPSITLDTKKTEVEIKTYVYDRKCKAYLEIKPVFMVDNNEYAPGYVKLYIDTSDFNVYKIREEGFVFNSLSAKMSQTPCKEEIPEFPTIALPIAAIIGLAFIFQKRKEN